MTAMTGVAFHTFGRGGIHPEPHKQATASRPIEDLPAPREVRLPLLQHLGDPATPCVKKGDLVARGQKVAEAVGTGVPLHATISGRVKPIDRYPHPTLVQAQAIVIVRHDEAPATLGGLPAGEHTLAIEATGRRHPLSLGDWIWVDGFESLPE